MVAVGSYLVSASQYPAGCSFEAVDERAQGDLGRVGDEQVHVVVFPVEFDEFAFEVSAYLVHDLFHVFEHGLGKYSSTVFRHKDQMGLEIVNACAAVSEFIRILHRPNGIIGGMEQTVRYRYRAYPTAVQEQSLKRLFGCCRVVWNDTVHLFRELFDPNGRMPSSSALQKKVLADAKRTEERAWLAEVANVPPAADASRCVAGMLERSAQDPAAASRPIPFAQTQSRQQREIHGQRVPSAGQRETVPRQDRRPENQMVTRPAIHAVKLHHHPGGGRLMVRQFRGQTRDRTIARNPGQ